jgi:hypothetical protein
MSATALDAESLAVGAGALPWSQRESSTRSAASAGGVKAPLRSPSASLTPPPSDAAGGCERPEPGALAAGRPANANHSKEAEMAKARFRLGRLVSTPGALEHVSHGEMLRAVARHTTGDWGTVCSEDAEANEAAVHERARLLSAYTTEDGVRFWIITEADRSVTTVLLPEEY